MLYYWEVLQNWKNVTLDIKHATASDFTVELHISERVWEVFKDKLEPGEHLKDYLRRKVE